MFAPFGGGQGSPSPFQQGGSGPSHSLGSLLALLTLLTLNVFAWYEMVSSRWISVKQTKQTKQRETRRESNSRPTVVRQSSDSRPTVQGIRHKSGTVVFSNAAYRCYVPWQFNAAYSMFAPKIRLHQVRQRYMHVNVCSHKFRLTSHMHMFTCVHTVNHTHAHMSVLFSFSGRGIVPHPRSAPSGHRPPPLGQLPSKAFTFLYC